MLLGCFGSRAALLRLLLHTLVACFTAEETAMAGDGGRRRYLISSWLALNKVSDIERVDFHWLLFLFDGDSAAVHLLALWI